MDSMHLCDFCQYRIYKYDQPPPWPPYKNAARSAISNARLRGLSAHCRRLAAPTDRPSIACRSNSENGRISGQDEEEIWIESLTACGSLSLAAASACSS